MSRHKLVKSMNLHDELDDFDGGDNYDYDGNAGGNGELSNEDRERLREGTAKVRSILGSDIPATNKEIEDSLWHYYYDVEKTIDYLLNNHPSAQLKKSEKHKDNPEAGKANESDSTPRLAPCSTNFSATDFFKDSPWLQIPNDRCGEILIEPLYPRTGLLGGSTSSGGAKVSKLAALAAARREKENNRAHRGEPANLNSSVALLDKLGSKIKATTVEKKQTQTCLETLSLEDATSDRSSKPQSRKYPGRQRKNSSPSTLRKEERQLQTSEHSSLEPEGVGPPVTVPAATPSDFARTMFGSSLDVWRSNLKHAEPLTFYVPRGFETSTNINPFAGLSPDDLVIKAQSSKGSKMSKEHGQSKNGNKAVECLVQDVNNVKLGDTPKSKSKHLDVIAEFKKSKLKNAANFVVIGHVDAGKSTLMGRLLYDLKVVDQRTIDRYRKEAENIGKSSFALAWVLDQGTEERNRGVTIDIAMNKFDTERTSFTILDAPGHRDFIPNMIAGASQADFAVLVIDASIGSFESGLKGQTREHALLVRSMGVQRVIIAVNKLDTVRWSQDRFSEISQQVSAFLTISGFLPRNISFVPCSGLTGDNIVRRVSDPLASWYTGTPLIDQLESSEPIARALEKPLRLTISDIFRGGVQNPLSISGRLDAGSLQVGDVVLAMPAQETATIKAIDVDSKPSDWAVAGQNAILHLSDIEAKHLRPGDVVCPVSAPIQNISKLVIKILAFDHVVPMHVEVHRGRLHVPGRISQLVAVLDKGSGAPAGKKKPRIVKPGELARIVVEVEEAVPLELGGKVILRAAGETVAAGLLE